MKADKLLKCNINFSLLIIIDMVSMMNVLENTEMQMSGNNLLNFSTISLSLQLLKVKFSASMVVSPPQ